MQGNKKAVFTLMVDNEFGVLTRITALIRRAGWNIRSLAVAETAVSAVSRLTICLECRNTTLEQVLHKLGKLNCVREVSIFEPESQVQHELALLRVKAGGFAAREGVFGELAAKLLYEDENEQLLAVSGESARIDEALGKLRENGLLEAARTGMIALKKAGEESRA
jgi:acetolactate synthase-1/3 small subunit